MFSKEYKLGLLKYLRRLFGVDRKNSPILIISKNPDLREYANIEDAIAELESDPNTPKDKLEKIKASLAELKNKGTIRIKNGDIMTP
jgi:hypothetical protein